MIIAEKDFKSIQFFLLIYATAIKTAFPTEIPPLSRPIP